MTEEQVREIVEEALTAGDEAEAIDRVTGALISAGLLLPRPAGLDPSIPSPDVVGSRPISQKVDEEIRAERERQRSQWGDTRTHDVGHKNEDWAKFIDLQLDKIVDEDLRTDIGGNYFFTPSYRSRLIKIAALCVAGLEAMDVKTDGGPTRLAEQHVQKI